MSQQTDRDMASLETPPSGPVGPAWRALRVAIGFLTRLPVAPANAVGPGYLAAATAFFPLVGAGIGLVAGAALFAAHAVGLPSLAGALIAIGAAILLTGALHEDGLADTADGLGARRQRDAALRILRDSRIGAYGVLALVLVVGLKAALIAELDSPTDAVTALVAAGALSRAPLPAIMAWTPTARAEGLAAEAGRPEGLAVTVAGATALLVAGLLLPPGVALTALLAGAAAAALIAGLACRRLGGHTGDVLGTAQQVTEVAVLAAAHGI